MFDTLNRQQQPFIQSGYGAMSRLNTLLGLGGGGGGGGTSGTPAPGPAYRPTTGGGMQQIVQAGEPPAPTSGMPQGARLKQLLALRAANGDTESARMLRSI